jgi:hypothetical protein
MVYSGVSLETRTQLGVALIKEDDTSDVQPEDGYFGMTETCQLQPKIATLKLCFDGLYSFIMYIRCRSLFWVISDLDSFLLTEVSILGDKEITSLIIIGGAPTGFGRHWLGSMHKIIRSRLDGFRTRQNLPTYEETCIFSESFAVSLTPGVRTAHRWEYRKFRGN